jgi:DNA-binding FadR family transcriptional regulator
MKHFPTVGKTDKLDAIFTALKNYIFTNKLEPGTEMPGERELAEQMGVSRKSVREALRIAQTLGLISITQGKKPTVADNSGSTVSQALALMLHRSKKNIYELLCVRQGLETQIARLAATNIEPEHLEKLEVAIQRMELHDSDLEACVRADLQFHEIVLEASNSLIFKIILSPLTEIMKDTRVETLRRSRERAILGHRSILTALKKNDPARSADAMFEHLEMAKEDINPNLEDM